jgi:hypothetical protein
MPVVATTNADRLRACCQGAEVELSRIEWYQIYGAAEARTTQSGQKRESDHAPRQALTRPSCRIGEQIGKRAYARYGAFKGECCS